MAIPNNILTQVKTWQMSMLGILQNQNCFFEISNKQYLNFQNLTANLGDTVSFDAPPRFTSVNSLVWAPQAVQQRVINLTVDQELSTSVSFNSQQMIFNVEDYLKKFGLSAVAEMGAKIEANLARISTVPYRFFGGDGVPINSYNQLALALAFHRNFGAAMGKAKFVLSDLARAEIVSTGLNQFVPRRNDVIANSWDVGSFDNSDFFTSNLLPLMPSGTCGDAGTTLTVVSVTYNSEGGVTNMVLSGAPVSDPNAILANALAQFQDGVSGQPNIRFLTFTGHEDSASPVQINITSQAGSTGGGNVSIAITPALQAAAGINQNITHPIQPGMQIKVQRTHRRGVIMTGDPFYLAMPSLPDLPPFYTSSERDKDTGLSFRLSYGAFLGQNTLTYGYDAIWGKTGVPEYMTAVLYSVNQ